MLRKGTAPKTGDRVNRANPRSSLDRMGHNGTLPHGIQASATPAESRCTEFITARNNYHKLSHAPDVRIAAHRLLSV
jgi:hypothetical protein